jgi:lipid-A-disaccharide synthase-like uncharacterized protein
VSRFALFLFVAAGIVTSAGPSASETPLESVQLSVEIPGVHSVYVEPVSGSRSGEVRYRVESSEEVMLLTPEAFAQLVYDRHRDRSFWQTLLNITTPVGIVWVGLGLAGQVVFAGRMIVQWLTSEREGRSVVPVAFWWMSLSGASMLLLYFIWRKDLVGVLGQSTGWLIYSRNLYLIYPREPVPEGVA